MPVSTSSGHPVAGGDIVPTEQFVSADGTLRLPRADALLPGTVLPVVQGGTGRTVAAATLTNKPNDPSATTSATLVMQGLGSGWAITPVSSGKVLVIITGEATTATAASATTVGGRYGTSTAPTNNAAVTGTAFGAKADFTFTPVGTGLKTPFAFNEIISLTAGTAYWFDLALASAANAASVSNLAISALEVS